MVTTPYEELLRDVRENGIVKTDRTGTGTKSVFGRQMRFDLSKGFPLITSKDTWFKGVLYELIWFLRGSTNVRWLQENGVTIWDAWADEEGNLGPVYGAQWRAWPAPNGESIDQLAKVIESIKSNPDSRRHLVTAWNPAEVDDMALPPCHAMFQFYVADGKLSCQLYQRSADLFLGVPFNIASYALLTHMVAAQCGLEVGEFIWTGGDTHIYSNHFDQVDQLLKNDDDDKLDPIPLPQLSLREGVTSIDGYEPDDVKIIGYRHRGKIKAPIAV